MPPKQEKPKRSPVLPKIELSQSLTASQKPLTIIKRQLPPVPPQNRKIIENAKIKK
jgi:hypothetical protein